MESKQAIDALSALAHEGRLEIFRLLVRRAPDAVPAGEIALAVGARGTTVSNQLAQLEAVGLIASRRRGRSVLYRIDLDAAAELLGFLAWDCCKGRPDTCAQAGAPFLREANSTENEAMSPEKPDQPYSVLFLCTANSARSILAEAILDRVGGERFRAFSAGSQPRGAVHPAALSLLEGMNYNVSGFHSKSWKEFEGPSAPNLDFVFTVCDNAANEVCPVWPGQPMSAHWGVADPAAVEGTEAERAVAFTEAYRYLFHRISAFASLPLHTLDSLTLQKRLDEIGRQRQPAPDAGAA